MMAIRPAVKDDKSGEYNGLRDSNLGHFFSRPLVFNHLRKMGLVTPRGKIVTEREWKNQNRVVSRPISSVDGFTHHPYGNAMSSLPESWRTPPRSCSSSVPNWSSKKHSVGRRAKTRRQERLSNVDSDEDSGSFRTSGDDDGSRTTRSPLKSGDSDTSDQEEDSDLSSDFHADGTDNRTTGSASQSRSGSSCSQDKQKGRPFSRPSQSNLSSYRGSQTSLMFSEHNQRRKADRSSSSLSRPTSSSTLSLASLGCVRDHLTGVNRRQGLRLLERLRRNSDGLPVALVGEPYLHSLPPDTPVFRPPVTDAQIRSRLYRSPAPSVRTPRPASADGDQLLPRCDITLSLQHTGRPAHVRLVQHTSPHTALIVYTGHLDTNEEFEVALSPFSAGSLGLVLQVDYIVCMRLNGCCEHRYSLGAMLDGPSGRLRLLGVRTLGDPCSRCQVRRKRKQFMSRWSVRRMFSGWRKEDSTNSSLNRNKSMSCSAVFKGGENTKPSTTFKFKSRPSNRIGIVNNQINSLKQTTAQNNNQSKFSTRPTGPEERTSRVSSADSAASTSVTSAEQSARGRHRRNSLSDASFYDKDHKQASDDEDVDSAKDTQSGSQTSMPLSDELLGTGAEETSADDEVEERDIDEEEVEEEVNEVEEEEVEKVEEEEEVYEVQECEGKEVEEDYSSSDEQENKSTTSKSGSVRILGS